MEETVNCDEQRRPRISNIKTWWWGQKSTGARSWKSMIREWSRCAENNAGDSHEGSPGGTSTFLGTQWVLVHDSVNGNNKNGPCDVSTSPFA